MAAKSSSPSPTATASPPSPGRPAARCRRRGSEPGPRGRGRRARVLGRATRGVPAETRAALLVPQDRQRLGRCPKNIAEEPLDLWHLISRQPSGLWLSGDDVRAAAAAWLLGALCCAGVDVNSYDRACTRFLFEDCETPAMQAIAGWIARARPADPGPPPDNRRASAARLLATLERAEVALGVYDRDLPGFLVEDCGTPAVRAIAGWLARVRPTETPGSASAHLGDVVTGAAGDVAGLPRRSTTAAPRT